MASNFSSSVVLIVAASGCGVTITNPPPPDTGDFTATDGDTGVTGATGGTTAGDATTGDGDGDGTTGDGSTGDGDGSTGDGDGSTGDGDGDGACAQLPTADECAACCAADHPDGRLTFDGAFSDCGCFGPQACYGTCSSLGSLCGPGGPPLGDCLTCAEQALAPGGGCDGDPTFDQMCTQDVECSAFVACLETC